MFVPSRETIWPHKIKLNKQSRGHIHYIQPGPALASAGPDWKHFAGPHPVACT